MTNEEIGIIAIQYQLLNGRKHQVLKELSNLDAALNQIKPVLMRGARLAKKLGYINKPQLKVLDLRIRKGSTLEEVARELDVTRERIRQTEATALEKLRQLSSHEKLQQLSS